MESVQELRRMAAEKAATVEQVKRDQEEKRRLHEEEMRQLKREKAATQLKDMAETWKERVMTSRFQAWVAFMRSLQKDAGAYKVMVAWRRMKRAMILAGFRNLLLERQRLEVKDVETMLYTPVKTNEQGEGVVVRVLRTKAAIAAAKADVGGDAGEADADGAGAAEEGAGEGDAGEAGAGEGDAEPAAAEPGSEDAGPEASGNGDSGADPESEAAEPEAAGDDPEGDEGAQAAAEEKGGGDAEEAVPEQQPDAGEQDSAPGAEKDEADEKEEEEEPEPAFPSYVVKLESGDEVVLQLWELNAKANRASNKLTVLMGHLARRTISLLPEDGKPSPFVQDFRKQMEEAIAEARAARLHHYKQRVALGEYRLQRARASFKHGQQERAFVFWSGCLFNYEQWAQWEVEAKKELRDWRDVLRKWNKQIEVVRQKRAQLEALYQKKIRGLRQAAALSTRMRRELAEQKRAKKHYQEQALRYAKALSHEAEAPVASWFGDVLADDADQQIPRVRKEQVQRESFMWTFHGSQ